MSKPEDPPPKGKPGPALTGAGRSASARSIGEELGDLDFEPDALLDSLLSDEPRQSPVPAPEPPKPAAPAPAAAPASAADGDKLFEPDARAWGADEVTLHGDLERVAVIAEADPPAGSEADDVDALLGDEPPKPPQPVAEARPAPLPPRPAVPPRPLGPPRPAVPPRPAPLAAAAPPPQAPEPPKPVVPPPPVEDLGLDEFSELPPVVSDSDAEIDALVGGIEPEGERLAEAEGEPPAEVEASEAPADETLADEGEDDLLPADKPGVEPLWTPPNWEEDRPASVHLAEQEALEAWLSRARWFEAEAASTEDPSSKSRVLLVASELFAMCGDAVHARQLAQQALALTPTAALAQRQARLIAAKEGDYKTVAASLDNEAKTSSSPAVRAHAVYMGAEVARILGKDAAQSDRRLDVLAKLDANDVRPRLMKIARELAQGSKPAALPAGLEGPLALALADIASLRGDAPPAPNSKQPAVFFERARRALEAGDTGKAGAAVAELSVLPGFELGARWLAAALLAPTAATRARAIELLGQIAGETGSGAARRALAARALEQGDPSALALLLEGAGAEEAELSAADRVALSALTGGGRELVQRWLAVVEADPRMAPFVSAAASVSRAADAPAELVCGEEPSRTAVTLGRALVAAQADAAEAGLLRAALEAYSVAHEDDPLVGALEAELALAAGAAFRVAQALASGADSLDRDGHLAAALVHEVGRDPDSATRSYAAASERGSA